MSFIIKWCGLWPGVREDGQPLQGDTSVYFWPSASTRSLRHRVGIDPRKQERSCCFKPWATAISISWWVHHFCAVAVAVYASLTRVSWCEYSNMFYSQVKRRKCTLYIQIEFSNVFDPAWMRFVQINTTDASVLCPRTY